MTMTPKTCANDCHVSLQHRTNNTVTDHDTNAAVSTHQHFYYPVLLSKSRAHYYHKTKREGSRAMGKYDLYHKAFLELAKDGRFQNKWLSDEYWYHALAAKFPDLITTGFDRQKLNSAMGKKDGSQLDDFEETNTIGRFRHHVD